METLGEAFSQQLVRVREVLAHYKAMGPPGIYAVIWITGILRQADAACQAQDTAAMYRLYPQLLEVQK